MFKASYAQRRFWFLDRLYPNSSLYNVPFGWMIGGSLDQESLFKAICEIVHRHESLRTTFRAVEDDLVQVVAEKIEFPFEVTDASEEANFTEFARKVLADLAKRPFDLEAGPLIRVQLLRHSEYGHALLFVVHHIAFDGCSLAVLAEELDKLYGAISQGRESPLPDLPVQYADYSEWQRKYLAGDALDEHLDYWEQKLSGVPPVLELPLDRPRSSSISHSGAALEFKLDAELVSSLRTLCRERQITPFVFLITAFGVLLSRYARQDNFCIGYPVAGRRREELEGLIGLFVNTLVLRIRSAGDVTFESLLAYVRASVLEADTYQDLPFEKIVERVRPERSLDHAPLFQVLFAFEKAQNHGASIPSLLTSPVPAPSSTDAKFDLTIELVEHNRHIEGAIEYKTDLFDRTTIERMVGHFKTLLEAVVANPQSRVQDLPLLTEAERHQILVKWNDTKADFPQDKCIHQLFEEQAVRSPDAIAVSSDDHALTYSELDQEANQLAHRLSVLGVMPGMLVAICLDRDIDLVVGVLGILKAGAAYLPIDPQYPVERIAYMIRDAAPVVTVTKSALIEHLGHDLCPVICIDDDRAALPALPRESPPVEVRPDYVAYVIYTSGSTGQPKGVRVTHRNVVRLFSVTNPRFGFSPSDTWTLFHSIAFDFSVWEMWGALLHGGRLVVVPYLTTRDPAVFLELLVRERVTMLSQTPSAFGLLIAEYEKVEPESFSAPRWIVLGGEALNTRALRPWFDRFCQVGRSPGRIMNMYGITETTVHVTWREVTAEDARDGLNDIGPPLPDLGLVLLDSHGQLVPVGVPGEIWVRGAGVAQGYLNWPELDEARFVSVLQSLPMKGRAYRSGDIARYRSDGALEYIGRADRQVKIRGFRVELGEVEGTLQHYPGVAKVLAAIDQRDALQPAIVVFVVAEQGAALTSSSLKQWLAQQLPTHLLPGTIILVDEFPYTVNQKADVKALLGLAERLPESQPHLEAALLDEGTTRLAELWADILGHRSFGLNDRFFDVGGTSIAVLRLRHRVDEAFGVRTQVADYFVFPTLALLNEHISSLANAEAPVTDAPRRQDGLLRREAIEARRKRKGPQ